MEGIFTEFENENALRAYPFAAGCDAAATAESAIPVGLFVDAALYPVNPTGTVYLSGVTEDGVFVVSDDTGEIMSGIQSGNTVELYDLSALRRHVGTLLAADEETLTEFARRGDAREYTADQTAFASGCVFPVVLDGVRSLTVGEEGPVAGAPEFENGASDSIRISSGLRADGLQTLRFDVLPRPGVTADDSIRRIICVVDGQTPFRIEKLPGNTAGHADNTILLTLDGVDKGVVCTAAHRENAYEMADTCKCEKDPLPTHAELPEAYQLEEVFIPPDDANPEGADNAFWLVVANLLGYDNPLSITLEDGSVAPKTEELKVVVEGTTADLAEGEMLDDMTSKGVVLQVPGLGGGKV